MARYSWLLFDADNTLFDFEAAEAWALEQAFLQCGAAYEPAHLTAFREIQRELWQGVEQGRHTSHLVRDERFRRLLAGLPGPQAPPAVFSRHFLAHLARGSQLLPGTLEALTGLGARYRLALATNGLSEVQRARLQSSALRATFEAVIISDEVGAAKPAPAFFQAALAALGRPDPARVLMIGDNRTADIEGAHQAGLDTCWFNPRGQPRPSALSINYEIAALGELAGLIG
jgi:YjjG family noncanonical pyrimidine nucleotidase